MLSDAKIRAAKPRAKPFKLTDSHRLYLEIMPGGSKLWRWGYAYGGKQRVMALGNYPRISLVDARLKRDEARTQLEEGHDPAHVKKLKIEANLEAGRQTFERVARAWHENTKGKWARVHAGDVLRSLERDVFPAIGSVPIGQLTPPRILEVLKGIENRDAVETAKRVRQRVSAVFVHAIAIGLVTADPAEKLGIVLKPLFKGRQPAITDLTQLQQMINDAEADYARPITRLALRLLALTAVRPTELRGAQWTEYRRYQAEAMKHRYAIRFPALTGRLPGKMWSDSDGEDRDPDIASAAMDAPPGLAREMAELIAFKTATLTAIGFRRNGVWGEETSSQKIEHLGLMFGALTASPKGVVAGFGLPLADLSFGVLVFPAVWDWYVQWRERRRGFYTGWEVEMLRLIASLTRNETGWMRQTPRLAQKLNPIQNLISIDDIASAQADWSATCDKIHAHAIARAKEIERVAQIHRDPFEPILPILEADSPLAEYRKITDEILRNLPDERRYPRRTAEAIRSFLLLRLGLHLGLRQKNLRQLMVCLPGQTPRTERQLEILKRGELRWSQRAEGWEVLISAVAFKNADSSFFSGKPFRLILPDLGDLYRHLSAYIHRHRATLLAEADDPGTLFVKTVKRNSKDASYDQSTIYEAWRLTIQRYGIWNPYTQRGVIKGLLPHGPHNVRDVLATHILKQTGSYEQASYAIQDTPEMVAKHYGRFFPQDKAALAANILNQVWLAA